MQKKELIYEKKSVDKRKTKTISIRTTTATADEIDKKASQSNLNRSDYICAACQNSQIIVVPEGREILQTVHEIRNILLTMPLNSQIQETNDLLGKVVLQLRNALSDDSKDR